ncbi:hypothetical protein JTE90_010995 [Oedothorax gibbosus]|uniref:Uncharacterized protein n=1 Tax=Oedothorax gibbosus TaxID=931172 RepID=A0AAV6VFE7_9ARAC|nr:hypothetical protein JTE90_010995 [Oedothorax gibbosus]
MCFFLKFFPPLPLHLYPDISANASACMHPINTCLTEERKFPTTKKKTALKNSGLSSQNLHNEALNLSRNGHFLSIQEAYIRIKQRPAICIAESTPKYDKAPPCFISIFWFRWSPAPWWGNEELAGSFPGDPETRVVPTGDDIVGKR